MMKNTQKLFVIGAAISIFVLSFLIGRATALRDSEKEQNNGIYTGTIPFPSTFMAEALPDEEASAKAKVPVEEIPEKKSQTQKKAEPTRLLFPCGNTVLKDYSQSAVYSETMKDWRAHLGIDYAAEKGDAVKSAWDGKVTKVYKDKLLGYSIEIKHSDSITGIYRNLSKNIKVKKGDNVTKGQIIGEVGKSGAIESKEPSHLHFEIMLNGVIINPISYVY